MPSKGIAASAREQDGQFVVLAGSSARGSWEGVSGGYERLYEQLCASGVLAEKESGKRYFTTDTAFSSPSAAVVMAGRNLWWLKDEKMTYGEWQE